MGTLDYSRHCASVRFSRSVRSSAQGKLAARHGDLYEHGSAGLRGRRLVRGIMCCLLGGLLLLYNARSIYEVRPCRKMLCSQIGRAPSAFGVVRWKCWTSRTSSSLSYLNNFLPPILAAALSLPSKLRPVNPTVPPYCAFLYLRSASRK